MLLQSKDKYNIHVSLAKVPACQILTVSQGDAGIWKTVF